jgi:hypothetical protein
LKKQTLLLIATVIMGLSVTNLAQAQESVNSSGGDATGSGGTIAYSLGQVAYTSNTSGGGTVDQGVQHAYEILITGIKETKLKISLTAFPNPTSEDLTLQISDIQNENLYYELYDMQGKMMYQQAAGKENSIELNAASWPSGIYQVIVNSNKAYEKVLLMKN